MNGNKQLFDDILQKMFLKTKILYIKWHSPGDMPGVGFKKIRKFYLIFRELMRVLKTFLIYALFLSL